MTENELILKWQQDRDIKARNEVIMRHKGMVAKVANSIPTPRFYDIDDLINEGMLGVIRAIDTFDTTRGIKFLTYAVFFIKRNIINYLASNHHGRSNFLNKTTGLRKLLENGSYLDTSSYKSMKAFSEKYDVPMKDILAFQQAKVVDNPLIDGDITSAKGRDIYTSGELLYPGIVEGHEDTIVNINTVERIIEILNNICDRLDRAAIKAKLDDSIELKEIARREGVSPQTLHNRYNSTIALLREKLL